jgi:hypothetical protein
MAKQLKDILKKAKSDSKLVPNRVSDMLKPGDEKKFASKHLIQKHGDANGNDRGVFDGGDVHYDMNFKDEKRLGRKRGDDEKVYEAVEKENTKCNESAKGTMCEVHGMADCKKVKPLTEKEDKVPTPPERPKDLDKKDTKKKDDETMGGQLAKTGMRTYEEVEEEVDLDEDTDAEYKADLPNMHKDLKAKKKNTSDMRREYGSSWKKLMHHTNQNYDMVTRDNAIAMAQKHMKEEYVTEVNLDKHYKSWMSSPDAPRDDHSGDYDKVSSLAKRYLNGSGVPEKDHDDVADKLTSKFHGESYEHVNEVLTKKTPTAEWIHDFVHSDNPQFEGKSKKKRTQMALAAYYSKQREKKN